jgi:hypothetical protein
MGHQTQLLVEMGVSGNFAEFPTSILSISTSRIVGIVEHEPIIIEHSALLSYYVFGGTGV